MDRLNESGRRLMKRAEKEAADLNYSEIKPAHLLLAIFHEDTIARQILFAMKVDIGVLEQAVHEILGKKPEAVHLGRLGREESMRTVFSLAMDSSREQKVNYLGPEHLLDGLSRSTDGVVNLLLRGRGINPDTLKPYLDQARLLGQLPEDLKNALDQLVGRVGVRDIGYVEAVKAALELLRCVSPVSA